MHHGMHHEDVVLSHGQGHSSCHASWGCGNTTRHAWGCGNTTRARPFIMSCITRMCYYHKGKAMHHGMHHVDVVIPQGQGPSSCHASWGCGNTTRARLCIMACILRMCYYHKGKAMHHGMHHEDAVLPQGQGYALWHASWGCGNTTRARLCIMACILRMCY